MTPMTPTTADLQCTCPAGSDPITAHVAGCALVDGSRAASTTAIPEPSQRRTYTEQIHQLYEMAKVADAAFQAQVERQFGKTQAGNYRYAGAKHNAATRAAADAFHIAMDAYLETCRAQRAPLSWTEVEA